MRHLFRLRTLALTALLFAPALALAQDEGIIDNPLKSDSLLELLLAFVRGVTRIGVIFLLLVLVYVGFQFVAAQGNEEKIRGARTMLLWTVVGGAIILGAELITAIVTSTAGSFAP